MSSYSKHTEECADTVLTNQPPRLPAERNQIFISYSHKDKKWLDLLQTHLTPYVRKYEMLAWDDNKIRAGAKWRQEIESALAAAKVGILLVTSDFLASDFIAKNEVPPLLKAAERDGLTILWIAVRPSAYHQTDIADFQAANNPAWPLSKLKKADREAKLDEICKQIMEATIGTIASGSQQRTPTGTTIEGDAVAENPKSESIRPKITEATANEHDPAQPQSATCLAKDNSDQSDAKEGQDSEKESKSQSNDHKTVRGARLKSTVVVSVAIVLMLILVYLLWGWHKPIPGNSNEQLFAIYVAKIKQAQQAWEDRHIEHMKELLEALVPKSNEKELRGFEWHYLWRLFNDDLRTFELSDDVGSVAFSLDGQTMAAGSKDGTVKLWNVANGEELTTLKGHTMMINAVTFFPDNKTLATGSSDQTVKLWDTATGQMLRGLNRHDISVRSVGFIPQRDWIISCSEDGVIKWWELASGQLLRTREVEAEKRPIFSMALSQDGERLALGSGSGTVELHDSLDLGNPKVLSVGEDSIQVRAVTFSADGEMLAAGTKSGAIKLWFLNRSSRPITLMEDGVGVLALAFSPDGQRLAVGNQDKTATLWNVSTREVSQHLIGHMGAVQAVAFTSSGRLLATASQDKQIKLWEINKPPAQRHFPGQVGEIQSLAFSPDNQQLLAVGGKDAVKLWDIKGPKERLVLKTDTQFILSLAFAPDGKKLAATSEDSTVKLWDIGNNLSPIGLSQNSGIDVGEIKAVAFSPQGRILVVGGQDKLSMWDMATVAKLPSQASPDIRAIAFSPDGGTLATNGGDGKIKIWEIAQVGEGVSLREIDTLQIDDQSPFNHIAFSPNPIAYTPDGRTLAAAYDNNIVRLWDVANKQYHLKSMLKGHANVIFSLAFSPDGKRLATASKDGTIKLWDTERGQELIALKAQAGEFRSVAFSPDGRTLVAGDDGGLITLWRTAF